LAGAEGGALKVLRETSGRPGYIFNLGPGVLPESDPDQLRRLVELIHERGSGVAAVDGPA
jgi:uroporphyrinogen decarboxylase